MKSNPGVLARTAYDTGLERPVACAQGNVPACAQPAFNALGRTNSAYIISCYGEKLEGRNSHVGTRKAEPWIGAGESTAGFLVPPPHEMLSS